ncbi:MAG: YggS family pyridoxal phosphate-dependent enzyme [Rhizobiaceae bacterium]|nr:YggS family pyridoxal phosphate-dependent enzyme [Hyphomicrobiales bacterium]NRB32330.1 YggS family pyridoxal phosphate-dependent enzyme [Rhizobiaceae bacterium]
MGLLEQKDRLKNVLDGIKEAESQADRAPGSVQLIAVSKTFDADHIRPVLQSGHRIFGENRVQESQGKWPQLKEEYPDTELHLIGPLQSNKTSEAVALFDVIHTVDREKIAKALAKEMSKQDRVLKLYVQVNTGREEQKAGIDPHQAVEFVERCRSEHGLKIVGLMCIPPFDENPGPHFALLRKLAEEAGVAELSMGMSADYQTAIEFGSTSVRVGSAIFGARG